MENGPQGEPKGTPKGPQNRGIRRTFHALSPGPPQTGKMEPKWFQNGAKMELKWSQNGARMELKWSKKGSKKVSNVA